MGSALAAPASHPLRRVMGAVRFWLACIITMMIVNAAVANPITLPLALKPVPFLVIASCAVIWFISPWAPWIVILCSSAISVGVGLRAIEVLAFYEPYDMQARVTGASIWVLISTTAVVFGFLNLVAISRRVADVAVWGHDG